MKRLIGVLALAAAVGTAGAAIDYSSYSASIALTKAEIFAISGDAGTATFYSSSFIKAPEVGPIVAPGSLLLIQDPSGSGTGTGLIRINWNTKAGFSIANDAALNDVADENVPAVDQDSNGLAVDPDTGTVYLVDREDTDEILKITSAGVVTALPNVTAATLNDSGVVLYNGKLYYANDGDDTVKEYNLATETESVFVSTASWTAATGGTALGNSAGPVRHGNSILFFDEAGFGGSDQVIAVDLNTAAVSVYAPTSLFGVGTAPGFSTMVVTSDGTIIGWDEFGQGAANQNFTIVPQGNGTPVRIPRTAIATALGIDALAVDPSDENSLCIITDTPTSVEVLFGISGTGDIGKLTFSAPAAVGEWSLY
jgi:hypothetical protein